MAKYILKRIGFLLLTLLRSSCCQRYLLPDEVVAGDAVLTTPKFQQINC